MCARPEKRKRSNEQAGYHHQQVQADVGKDNVFVLPSVSTSLPIPKLNQWKLTLDIKNKAKQIAKEKAKQVKAEASLKRATRDLQLEKKVSCTMIATSQKEAADSLKVADQQLIQVQTLMDKAIMKLSAANEVIEGHDRLVRCAVREAVQQEVTKVKDCMNEQFDKHSTLLMTKHDNRTAMLWTKHDKHTTKLTAKHLKDIIRLEESANKVQTKLQEKLKNNVDKILAGKIAVLAQKMRAQKKEDLILEQHHQSNIM